MENPSARRIVHFFLMYRPLKRGPQRLVFFRFTAVRLHNTDISCKRMIVYNDAHVHLLLLLLYYYYYIIIIIIIYCMPFLLITFSPIPTQLLRSRTIVTGFDGRLPTLSHSY